MSDQSSKLPKHHYMPVFFLREWAKQDGRLTEFSRPTGHAVKARPCGPKGTGYVRGLYRLDHLAGDAAEVFERLFFSQVDNLAKDAFDILHRRTSWTWTNTTRSAWSRFVVGMMFRNPERVQATRKYIEDFSLENYDADKIAYEAQKKPDDPEFLEYLVRFVAYSAIDWTKSMIAASKVAQHINNMRWSMRDVSNGGLKLFTSDRPIVMSNGMAYPDSHLVVPIGPTKAFIACNNEETERALLGSKAIDFTRACNEKILRYAQKYAWNTEDEQLNVARRHLSLEANVSREFFDAPPNRNPKSIENAAV